MATRVLFVCLGNICRSPMAEGIFAKLTQNEAYLIESAGTGSWHIGEPPDRRAQAVALDQGVDISGQRARKVTPADFDRFDHIVAMDNANLTALRKMQMPGSHAHLSRLLDYQSKPGPRDVPDPYYEDGFDHVFALIERACRGLRLQLNAQEQ